MGVKTVTLASFVALFCLLASKAFAVSLIEDYEEDMETLKELLDTGGDGFNAQSFQHSDSFVADEQNPVALNLAYTLACYLDKTYNWWNVMKLTYRFSYYGCYCGVGGKGKVMDAVDQCCKMHDGCYTEAAKEYNTTWSFGHTVGVKYATKCIDGTTTCSGNSLGTKACYCDRDFGECVAEKNKYYKSSHMRVFVKKWCVAKYGTA